jgi:EAL domain-containing protein (putative c-di-GMP-specific phosphodiesterase class I)/FixJ family two-component response regulator
MKNMLVIDDDSDIGEFVSEVARACGYFCDSVTNFDDFKALLGPDVSMIMVDLMMPGVDGIEVLRYLGEQGCQSGIILMSGFDKRVLSVSEQLARELGLNVLGHFQKPIRFVDLESFLNRSSKARAVHATPEEPGSPISAEELRRAIQEDQMVVHYQPQMDIRSHVPVGVEALVRWNHPVRGLLAPDLFIALSESLGLIDDLTWLIVKKALGDRKQITKHGWRPTLSINVSAVSLRDLEMPEKFLSHAAAFDTSPKDLVIEITESGLIKELRTALDILARLRVRGMDLSIDDFGTGYSMLQQLKRVPANELKIDQMFVQAMEHDEEARAMVCKTIELGHELGMRIVAEGVETEEQLLRLGGMGCDIAQGYLFSRPVPLQEILAWLKTTRMKQEA